MTFDQADFFFVPLLDGRYGIGQIFEVDQDAQSAVFCGLTLRTAVPGATIEPLLLDEIIAFARIETTQLTTGNWPLGGFDQIPRFDSAFNFVATKALGFPDNPAHDPAVIEAFLSACHGLYSWTAFGDLFDKIHRSDVAKPQAAIG